MIVFLGSRGLAAVSAIRTGNAAAEHGWQDLAAQRTLVLHWGEPPRSCPSSWVVVPSCARLASDGPAMAFAHEQPAGQMPPGHSCAKAWIACGRSPGSGLDDPPFEDLKPTK
jgi:hypothetical protein